MKTARTMSSELQIQTSQSVTKFLVSCLSLTSKTLYLEKYKKHRPLAENTKSEPGMTAHSGRVQAGG